MTSSIRWAAEISALGMNVFGSCPSVFAALAESVSKEVGKKPEDCSDAEYPVATNAAADTSNARNRYLIIYFLGISKKFFRTDSTMKKHGKNLHAAPQR